ncbi:hypothetical protein BKA70DRAFT_480305 [Coprinopsis sp. MPI-PUGE-AT-0042]|nr:hypothetical protein BKA70DRAFT_480305 [Coprinopsis sp. MPI-PUGE-AT-0042]
MSYSSNESSSSRTPSPSGSPTCNSPLTSFDPFAVHPFTSYAGPSQPPTKHNAGMHVLPHPSVLSLDAHAPLPVHQPSPASHKSSSKYSQGVGTYNGAPSGYSSYSPNPIHASQTFKSVHVPFRQDTSSPDLADVLRRKRA